MNKMRRDERAGMLFYLFFFMRVNHHFKKILKNIF